ncbi:hypothetical protein PENSPDRAFT_647443 [Peniophora sp. CONT]|nr:hypothetical protein PENSPDRAFT_647443 [Peniophora sp. CONT]
MSNVPSSTTYPYEPPTIVEVLILSSYVYVLNAVGAIFETGIHADLVGYLVVGMVYGPPLGNIIPTAWLQCFTSVGYIGLILLVFQGGLVTDLYMILPNIALSLCIAVTGIALPIVLSIAYIPFALDYTFLQGFAAGASLSSTSLGTTLAVLSGNTRASATRYEEKAAADGVASSDNGPIDIRKTRLGTVLMTAALADDVVALVLAAIVPKLEGDGFTWRAVVRPVLVSVAFVICIPVLSKFIVNPLLRRATRWDYTRLRATAAFKIIATYFSRDGVYLLVLVGILSGFVTGASYAGTSELLGAYVAGCWLRATGQALLHPPASETQMPLTEPAVLSTFTAQAALPKRDTTVDEVADPFTIIFERYIELILHRILAPLFFGSVGSSIPFLNLWRPARVVWQGFVFSVLMAIGKAAAGIWWLVWPRRGANDDPSSKLSRKTGALFIGLALIARGEIALLVASLARSILQQEPGGSGTQEELYAIVMWGTLACTVGGAMGVGAIVSRMR